LIKIKIDDIGFPYHPKPDNKTKKIKNRIDDYIEFSQGSGFLALIKKISLIDCETKIIT
jgi:hypothetical protein